MQQYATSQVTLALVPSLTLPDVFSDFFEIDTYVTPGVHGLSLVTGVDIASQKNQVVTVVLSYEITNTGTPIPVDSSIDRSFTVDIWDCTQVIQ